MEQLEHIKNNKININIIGAGLAGLSCAIHLAYAGVSTRLISLQDSERAQSVLAEGGINAALNTMGEEDDPDQHFIDTIKGGVMLADPNAVRGLCENAPDIVKWLSSIGVPFQRKSGNIVLRNFGGQKKKRTAYVKSSTGKVLMTALIDEARRFEALGIIERYPHHKALRPIIHKEENDTCIGVEVLDIYSNEKFILDGIVVIACGGLNGIFSGMTTGTVNNTGMFTAEFFKAGGLLSNLEFIQYHPTTAKISGKRLLVSEAARGEGGRLFVNRSGSRWYFMEELYPELKNLMPRDVVSREIYDVLNRSDCDDQVYLDMTGLSEETWSERVSDLREEIIDYFSIDPAKDAVPVSPGIHFFMGGIKTDECHRTNISGIYAAGECACQYHGANRLGGNSLLGAIYGGRKAAECIIDDLSSPLDNNNFTDSISKSSGSVILNEDEVVELETRESFSDELSEILISGLGIVRSEDGIKNALNELSEFKKKSRPNQAEEDAMIIGHAMLLAALKREESRGAHKRSDHPKEDEKYRKTTVVSYDGKEINIWYEDIPEERR